MLTGPGWLTDPGWLGLPRDIWLIAASALLLISALLAQEVPRLRTAVIRGRALRRRGRRLWDRIGRTSLSDDQWLAELARMRTERRLAELARMRTKRSGQLGPAQGRDWDPPGAELAGWLDTEQLWPGDPRRPPA
jgi:hypothetical protein